VAYPILSAFLEGFTGGSLFTRARRPGAPTQLFADDEADCSQSALVALLLKKQHEEDQIRQNVANLFAHSDTGRTTDGIIDREYQEEFAVKEHEPQQPIQVFTSTPLRFDLAGRKFRIEEEVT